MELKINYTKSCERDKRNLQIDGDFALAIDAVHTNIPIYQKFFYRYVQSQSGINHASVLQATQQIKMPIRNVIMNRYIYCIVVNYELLEYNNVAASMWRRWLAQRLSSSQTERDGNTVHFATYRTILNVMENFGRGNARRFNYFQVRTHLFIKLAS